MRINIRIERGRIHLKSDWRPSIAEDCKSISGANWSKTKGAWTYPLSMHTLRRMRQVFGDELVVDPELWSWAKAERKKELRLKRLAKKHDAKLLHVPRVSPRLAAAMGDRKYQRSAARFAAHAGSYLLADEPGLGKTATALAGLIESELWHGDHLIVAPKSSLSSVWGRQIDFWTPGEVVVVMPEGAAKRRKVVDHFMSTNQLGEPRFLIVNPAMIRRQYGHLCKTCKIWKEDVDRGAKIKQRVRVRGKMVVKTVKLVWPLKHHLEDHKTKRTIKLQDWPEILDHDWTSVIIDESHELFAAYTPSNITQSTQGALDLKAEARYALTGTPLRGQERRIWGTLNFLSPKEFHGYWNFIGEFFEVSKGFFGSDVLGLLPEREKELRAILDRHMLRRTRAEVRSELPLGQRIDVLVEMSPKHFQQYEEFRLWGETELESGSISGQGLLSELTRLKQMAYGLWTNPGDGHLIPTAESPKLDYLLEWLRARGITGTKSGDWLPEPGSGYKYVLASNSSEILDSLERELNKKKIPTLKITGAVTGTKRDKAMDLFQSTDEEYRVCLINTKAGGVAIELDAWCDEMMILDETFIADDQVQLEGRINNRSGRVAPRSWHYLRTAGTIEQRIAEANYSQHDLQHKLLDGRRGVKTALHLLRGNT